MLIISISLFLGGFLANIVIDFIIYVLAYLFKLTPKIKIFSIFLTGLILIFILSLLIISPNPELNSTTKNVEELTNNININSPLENYEILDAIKVVLFCTEILSTLAVISFIMFGLLISIKLNLNKLDKIENAFLIKLINLLKKANNIYIFIWGVLTLFDMGMVLYLTIRLSNIL